jgi:nucleotide-sensitive chloride channel 1A
MVVVTSLGPPEEGVRHVQPATTTYINQKPLGKGTLHISESRVSWVGDAGHVFSLEYPHIAMHAISRDLAAFPNAECLYLMIDVRLVDSDGTPTPSSTPESSDADDDDDDDDDSGEGMTEIRFIPDDKSKLHDMFTVSCAFNIFSRSEVILK